MGHLAFGALFAGPVAAALTRPLDRLLGWDRFDGSSVFGFATPAFLLRGHPRRTPLPLRGVLDLIR